jgi:hypothetical protein
VRRPLLLLALLLPLGCHAFRASPTCNADSNCPIDLPRCEVETGECVATLVLPPPPPPDAGDTPVDAGDPSPVDAGDPPVDAGDPLPVDAGPPDDGGAPPDDAGPPPVDAGPQCFPAPALVNDFGTSGGSGKCDPWSRDNASCQTRFTCQSGTHLAIGPGNGFVTRSHSFALMDQNVEICFFYGEVSGQSQSTVTLEVDPGGGFVEVFRDDDFAFGDAVCQETCVDISSQLPAVHGNGFVRLRVFGDSDGQIAVDRLVVRGERCF